MAGHQLFVFFRPQYCTHLTQMSSSSKFFVSYAKVDAGKAKALENNHPATLCWSNHMSPNQWHWSTKNF